MLWYVIHILPSGLPSTKGTCLAQDYNPLWAVHTQGLIIVGSGPLPHLGHLWMVMKASEFAVGFGSDLCCHLVTKLCLTLCNPMDWSLPGASVQARILEWVAISYFKGLPDPQIEPVFLAWQAASLPLNHPGSPGWDLYYNGITIVLLPLMNPASLIFLQVLFLRYSPQNFLPTNLHLHLFSWKLVPWKSTTSIPDSPPS